MKNLIYACLVAILVIASGSAQAQDQQVRVTVTSNAPTGGVALTPLWAGFHDGSFDSYNGGLSSQLGLESLAEDGDTSTLSNDFLGGYTYIDSNNDSNRVFSSQLSGRVDGTIGSAAGPPPIQPGETVSMDFNIDLSQNQYFSYASMILPSNDFFVGNGNPFAHDLSSLFSGGGPISFDIGTFGTANDAGTEVNDFNFSPANGLFGLPGGQTGPNQGATEAGVNTNVTSADPFASFLNLPPGTDLSLLNFNDTALYANGIATITITAIPEPTSATLIGLGLGGLSIIRRRRS